MFRFHFRIENRIAVNDRIDLITLVNYIKKKCWCELLRWRRRQRFHFYFELPTICYGKFWIRFINGLLGGCLAQRTPLPSQHINNNHFECIAFHNEFSAATSLSLRAQRQMEAHFDHRDDLYYDWPFKYPSEVFFLFIVISTHFKFRKKTPKIRRSGSEHAPLLLIYGVCIRDATQQRNTHQTDLRV